MRCPPGDGKAEPSCVYACYTEEEKEAVFMSIQIHITEGEKLTEGRGGEAVSNIFSSRRRFPFVPLHRVSLFLPHKHTHSLPPSLSLSL